MFYTTLSRAPWKEQPKRLKYSSNNSNNNIVMKNRFLQYVKRIQLKTTDGHETSQRHSCSQTSFYSKLRGLFR